MATKTEKMQGILLTMEEKIRNKITDGHSFITLEINQTISNINHLIVQNAVKLETFIKEELSIALNEFSDTKETNKDENVIQMKQVKQEVLPNFTNAFTPRELGLESPSSMRNMSDINDMMSTGNNMELTNSYYGNNIHQPTDPYNPMEYPLNTSFVQNNYNDSQEGLIMPNNQNSSPFLPEDDGSYSHDGSLALMFGAKLDQMEKDLNSVPEAKPKALPIHIPDAYKTPHIPVGYKTDINNNATRVNTMPVNTTLATNIPASNVPASNIPASTTPTYTPPARPKVHAFNQRGEFTCTQCNNYTFPLKHLLTRHIISIHKRQKNLECDQCSYAFGNQADLDSHIMRIHNKKNKGEKKSWKQH